MMMDREAGLPLSSLRIDSFIALLGRAIAQARS